MNLAETNRKLTINKAAVFKSAVWLSLLLATSFSVVLMVVMAFSGDYSVSQWVFFLITPAYVTVGTFIILRHPQNRIGRLCLLIGWLWLLLQIGFYQEAFADILNQSTTLTPLIIQFSLSGGQVICLLIFVYLPLLFPDGQYLSAGWQRFGRGLALLIAIPIILTLIKSGPIFDWGSGEGALAIQNPFGIHWPWLTNLPIEPLIYVWGIPTMLATFAAIVSLGSRWRRSDRTTRQQIKWVVYFLSTMVAAFILIELMFWLFGPFLKDSAALPIIKFIYESLATIVWVGFPLVIGLAIFKYRLYDIDIIINRTLVYGSLSLGIVTIYVLVVGALGALFQSQGSILFALLATSLIAVLFQPLRDRLQQRVNRLMFGDRDDPYAVLSKLSSQLQTAATPEATLESVVETVAETLKLPYVAIELADEQGPLGGAVTGKPLGEKLEIVILYQNDTIGRLVVSPRSPGETFNQQEQRLLADIAAQTGPLAHAVRLTAALQRSREKLVLTREEERRRIRRDLHDGLGPVLAGQGLKLSAARHLLKKSPHEAGKLLEEVMQQNEATVGEVRRLVYELRPPALDDLGLVGAIEQEGRHLMRKIQLTVTAVPNPLPNLPAAVEVATYRIIMEALTNVGRHANARRCQVCLDAGEALLVEVVDDGIGFSADKKPGVGLTSMRERTAELGGEFSIAANPSGGTRIKVMLPY